MEYRGIRLEGRCNGKHTAIRYVGDKLFSLTIDGEDEPLAERMNPRVLNDFALMDGALTVKHDYDLRLAP